MGSRTLRDLPAGQERTGQGSGLDVAAARTAVEPLTLIASQSPMGVLDALDAGRGDGETWGSGPCRLAILDPTPQRLSLARRVVGRGTPWRGRNDVWFTDRPLLSPRGNGAERALRHEGQIAFLFPGFEPDANGCVDDVADHFGLPRPAVSAAPPAGGAGSVPGGGIIEQAVDIVAVNRLLAGALRAAGAEPDLLAGHSLGEWTAMIVSGMCELDAVDRFFAPVRAGKATFPDVAYAAVGCGADVAGAVVGGLADVFVSHDNCPHQSVVCGRPAQVDLAVATLRAQGVLSQIMPFRSGFHTPLLGPCLEAGREAFAALAVHRPAIPVWSATSASAYPEDAAAVRTLVVRHLLEPVRFRELVDELYAAGVRAFVQVGAGSLVGFVEDTLGKREHLAIAAQSPGRSGRSQLSRVLAALWVEGATPAVPPPPAPLPPLQLAPLHRPAPLPLPQHQPGHPLPLPQHQPGHPLPLPQHQPGHPPPLPQHQPGHPLPLPQHQPGHPVLAAFEATLAEATAAAQAVMAAWAPEGGVAQPPDAATSTAQLFSLDTMPHLRDHCLFRQAAGWADDSDRFPVVPMTALLEVMAGAVRARFPGSRVVGFSRVRALRWLAVAPCVTAPVEVARQPDGRVSVAIGGYAEGLIELAASYPAPPPPHSWPLRAERMPHVDARSLYEDGWMFHGPGFQGVREISAVGEDGIRGVLTALPAPGALLDAAGQLAGHWAQVSAGINRLAFPVSIDAVRFYGPPPPTGEPLACAVRIRSFTDEILQADLELVGGAAGDAREGAGAVWARIEGWRCRRFATDDITWPAVHTRPSQACLGEQQPGGWCLVRERWPDRASLEYTMRRYLSAPEREDYAGRNPRAQRTWLLGRIAAKDAARGWLWKHGSPPLFPAQLRVGNEAGGRPWIRGPWGGPQVDLTVSLAHCRGVGVAMVRPSGGCALGIDVEAIATVGAAAGAVGSVALTSLEQELLRRVSPGAGPPSPVWLTRFWTAKEAVAKAVGTGLAGRPRDFAVTGADGDHLVVTSVVAGRGTRTHRVHTCVLPREAGASPEHVVAWTEDPVERAEPSPLQFLQFVPETRQGDRQ